MKVGKIGTTFSNFSNFWMALGLLILGYFILSTIKYFMLNFVVLNSNKTIHNQMIYKLMRSPCSYFDVTSTGKLNNIFSSDLGIMDSFLAFILIDSIEGVLVSTILLGNVISINKLFLIPAIINIVFIVIAFVFSKRSIIAVKNINLKLKTPIFSRIAEMLNGLVQIQIFNRRYSLLL